MIKNHITRNGRCRSFINTLSPFALSRSSHLQTYELLISPIIWRGCMSISPAQVSSTVLLAPCRTVSYCLCCTYVRSTDDFRIPPPLSSLWSLSPCVTVPHVGDGREAFFSPLPLLSPSIPTSPRTLFPSWQSCCYGAAHYALYSLAL